MEPITRTHNQIKKLINKSEGNTQITLCWRIDEGYTWLDTPFIVNLENFEEIVDNYIKETQDEAMDIKRNYFIGSEEEDFYIAILEDDGEDD